jgi:hypothetical protein
MPHLPWEQAEEAALDDAALQRRAGNAPLVTSARVKMNFENKYVR